MFFPSKGPIPEGMSEKEHRESAPNEKPYPCTTCDGIRLAVVYSVKGQTYTECVVCGTTSKVV